MRLRLAEASVSATACSARGVSRMVLMLGVAGAAVVALDAGAPHAVAAQTFDTARIAQSHWSAREVAGEASESAARLELEFGGVDEFTGYAGCNRFNGYYQIHDGEADAAGLEMVVSGRTRQTCADDVMTLEGRFLDALRQTRRVQLNDQEMTLLDAQGAALTRLRRN